MSTQAAASRQHTTTNGGRDDNRGAARSAGLRYVTDDIPGITRRRCGRGWAFYTPDGELVRDGGERERLLSLAVPPAWTDVWICPFPHGHLQATGRDDRGRKQYRYHERWREVRDAAKFSECIPFAEALPRIRRTVRRHLAKPGLPREKVLAAVVRLLDQTGLRVGNEEYVRENGSYGLTTLRDRHARFDGSTLRLHFRGKGGKQVEAEVDDVRLAAIVRECQEIPGQELFQYHLDDGTHAPIESADVNDYIRDISGGDFTAKDFRTWAGTVLCANALIDGGEFATERDARSNVVAAIKQVAEELSNTPAVCRNCYVHPEVVEGYVDGALLPAWEATPPEIRELRQDELRVLAFLRSRARSRRAA